MNEHYWREFYEKRHTLKPTSFAKLVRKLIQDKDLSVYDFGCGNGRDTYYLSKKWRVLGIDNAVQPKNRGLASFIKRDIHKVVEGEYSPDLIYARFFIHSIDDQLFNKILEWGSNLIAFEVRSSEDDKSKWVYKDHERVLRSKEELLTFLYNNKYRLIYFIESRGLAKYKGEDPLIIRIIAQKG